MIEWRPKHLLRVEIGTIGDRREHVARDHRHPRKALPPRSAHSVRSPPRRIDGVAVEVQGRDEASLGMIGLEHLDVRRVIDALGGQGGDTVAMDDRAHAD